MKVLLIDVNCKHSSTGKIVPHKENVYGVQFHPEKSHAFGMALLEAFAEAF